MWVKIKYAVMVFVMVSLGPIVMDMFRYPITLRHKIGFYLLGLAAVSIIWTFNRGERDKIQKVFEAKKVSIDGQYPILIKEWESGEENV